MIDGDLDFVCGGRISRPERLYWFEYRGPDDWVRHGVGMDYRSDVGLANLRAAVDDLRQARQQLEQDAGE